MVYANAAMMAEREPLPATVSVPRLRAEVVDGPNRGLRVELGDAPVLIGRAPQCGIVLADSAVSWVQAELSQTLDGVYVRNLGARDGLQLGAALVEEARLPAGAILTLGATRIALVETGAEQALPYAAGERFGQLIARSPAMKLVLGRLQRLAAPGQRGRAVLIEGPAGAGKKLAARALHDLSGPRRPFVVVACAELAANAVAAELAAAFERAAGGTLVLDEVAALPPDAQALVATSLAQLEGETRVVATTRRALAREMAAGQFRDDLFFALATARLRMPALRDRREDVAPLVDSFLEGARLPSSWRRVLEEHDWPGNARELRDVVERARGIEPAPVPAAGAATLPSSFDDGARIQPIAAARAGFEREYLRALLARTNNNVRRAAQLAGLTRQGLYGLLARNGLRGGEGA